MSEYSIIYYNHKNQFDKVAVGLAFWDCDNFFIDYQKSKLIDLKKYNGFDLFCSALFPICKKVKTVNQLSDLRFLYNNIIQITKEIKIDIECNESNFHELMDKIIKI